MNKQYKVKLLNSSPKLVIFS